MALWSPHAQTVCFIFDGQENRTAYQSLTRTIVVAAFEWGLSFRTIKGYLSAIRHLQISMGYRDMSYGESRWTNPRIIRQGGLVSRLHHQSWELWSDFRSIGYQNMAWMAATTCLFGFLLYGELTTPSATVYDPATHTSSSDLSVDRRDNATLIRLWVKASQTDPFHQGMDIGYVTQLWNGSSYETLNSKLTFGWIWLDLSSLFHNWNRFITGSLPLFLGKNR